MKNFKEFLLEREYDVFNDSNLYEMSNYDSTDTGLPVKIWVDEKSEGLQHGPRIKVSRYYGKMKKDQTFTVTLHKDDPRVIGDRGEIKGDHVEDVRDWIKLNHEHLMDHYHGRISSGELTRRMVKL